MRYIQYIFEYYLCWECLVRTLQSQEKHEVIPTELPVHKNLRFLLK